MKNALASIFFCFLSFVSIAQLSGKTVYAKSIAIQGDGKGSFGKITTIEGLHSYLFLMNCGQGKDSSGYYTTSFKLGNPNRIVAYNILVVMQFDKIVDSVLFNVDGIPKNPSATFADNGLGASYRALELSAKGTIVATVFSKKKVFTTISGLEGELHN
jgi:hypothetical protein